MQDTRTGEMIALDNERAKKILEKQMGKLHTPLEVLQKACDEAQPDRSRHGPVFQLGEILIIRGGRFQVAEMRKEGIFLKGLPTK